MRKGLTVALCLVLAACATSRPGAEKPKSKSPVAAEGVKEPVVSKEPAPVVTIMQDMDTLGDTVVHFGKEVGGSLVAMKGVDNRLVPPMNYEKTPFKKVVTEIAGSVQCNVATYPNYMFVYPAGYETLLSLSVANQLEPALAARTVAMTFGSDTPLHKVFALLGVSLGTTFVADNVISETCTGAVTLVEIPVADALEAILKSARILPGALQMEVTPEYVFFYSGPAVPPRTTLINADALSAEDNAYLDTVVDLYLPSKPKDANNVEVPPHAVPLERVLDSLSEQLGRKVVAAAGMEEFPVSPCALLKMRVRTALDLLIRQWPLPDFGYGMEGGQIVIRRNKG